MQTTGFVHSIYLTVRLDKMKALLAKKDCSRIRSWPAVYDQMLIE